MNILVEVVVLIAALQYLGQPWTVALLVLTAYVGTKIAGVFLTAAIKSMMDKAAKHLREAAKEAKR